jgi:flagellar FliJ protein
MPKFQFQLEGVLRHRKNVEKEKQRALAEAMTRMSALKDQLAGLDQTVQQANAEMRDGRLVGRLDLTLLAAHRRFLAATQRQAVGLAQKMALVQRDIDAARLALLEAAKGRKTIEKLREKQFEQWRSEMLKKEDRQTDEVGTQAGVRWSYESQAQADEVVAVGDGQDGVA